MSVVVIRDAFSLGVQALKVDPTVICCSGWGGRTTGNEDIKMRRLEKIENWERHERRVDNRKGGPWIDENRIEHPTVDANPNRAFKVEAGVLATHPCRDCPVRHLAYQGNTESASMKLNVLGTMGSPI